MKGIFLNIHYVRNSGVFNVTFSALLTVALASGSAGCLKSGSSGSTTAANTSPSSAANPLSCSHSAIDAGQKGTVTAVARGVYSDVKLIPNSSFTAVAFADPGALALKLVYGNGSEFTTEVVSGDGTGAFVRLAFLSSGIPLVFWTLGGNLKAAIRSATLDQAGTWSAGVIDTGTAPRALEVAVNPLDQVGVSFLTDTAAAGRPKFLYCDAPCASPSGFQTMTPNPYIENTAIVAAQTSIGFAWCKNNATSYFPAATYSVTGVTRYAVCQNTLANCLSNSNWSTANVVATGNLGSKLQIDASVTGDVARVVSVGAAGITPYKMGTTACTAAPVNLSAGTAMGGATSGTQWMSLLQDTAGKFHVAANEGTASVRYYNSATTDLTGTWNAAGIAETVTLAAAHAGAAVLDPTNLAAYISYGTNAAPFDLRLARVADYTTASNTASFTRFTPDVSGTLQLSAANSQQRLVAVAATAAGRPAVAYVDFSVGAAANAKLKYALRSGASASDAWPAVLVPGTANPQYPSLAFDESNKPWIGYFEASTNRFYLAKNSASDGTGSWTSYEFPSTPSGAPAALPAANHTAVGMYYAGGVAKPVMAMIDANTTSKAVKAAMFNPSTLSWSTVATIDGLTGGSSMASHLSIDFTTSGVLSLAFQDLNVTRVKYSESSNGTSWSTPLNVSAIGHGQGARIRINPATGKPGIAYFDRANNAVYLATCTGTCATGGWTSASVETAAGVAGLATGNEQLLSASLSFGAAGTAYVAYPRGQGNDGALVLAQNTSGAFSPTLLAPGVNGSLPGSSALNFGVSGWGVASVRNAVGGVTAVYLGPGNWLYSASCGD